MYNLDNKRRKSILALTIAGSFLAPFMGSAINIALPVIGKDFSADAVTLSWIAMSYLLSAAVLLLPFGKYADMYGRSAVFIYGVIVFSVGSSLCALSMSSGTIIAYRIVQGIGASMVSSTSIALLALAYPVEERGKALGINTAFVYLGLSSGPFIGGILTQFYGWRSVFAASALLGIFTVIFAAFILKKGNTKPSEEKFDTPGAVFYGISLAAIMYGFSSLAEKKGILLVVLGILNMAAFISREKKSEKPLLDIKLFTQNKVFAFSNLASFLNYGSTASLSMLLSLYLYHIKGFSVKDAGIILVLQPVVMALLAPISGKLSDKFEPRIVSSFGMFFTGIGLSFFVFLGHATPLYAIITGLLITGFGLGFFASPNTNAIMTSVERQNYGTASGMLATMRFLGQTFSMGIVMLVFSVCMGRVQIVPDIFSKLMLSIKIIFSLSALLCFLGIFASIKRGNVR